jgi:hypothetical protein
MIFAIPDSYQASLTDTGPKINAHSNTDDVGGFGGVQNGSVKCGSIWSAVVVVVAVARRSGLCMIL